MHRLFLVEGLATIVFGVVLFFCLPDCKDSVEFLGTSPNKDVSSTDRKMAFGEGESLRTG